jgi:hypothetical protein
MKLSRGKNGSRDELVAEAGRDRDLVAALGAAAAQHGGTGLGGHAAQEAVDLAPAAAIGLKGALRHRRILFSIFGICIAARFAPLLDSTAEGLYACMRKRVRQQLLSIPKFAFEGNSIAGDCLTVLHPSCKQFFPHSQIFTDSGANALSFANLNFLSSRMLAKCVLLSTAFVECCSSPL